MAFRKALEYYSKGFPNVKHFFRLFSIIFGFVHRRDGGLDFDTFRSSDGASK